MLMIIFMAIILIIFEAFNKNIIIGLLTTVF